jgi:hypothetical protein
MSDTDPWLILYGTRVKYFDLKKSKSDNILIYVGNIWRDSSLYFKLLGKCNTCYTPMKRGQKTQNGEMAFDK